LIILEQGMKRWKRLIFKKTGLDLQRIPGSGAAGGIGGAMVAFYNARLVSGTDLLIDELNFNDRIKKADLIITGEGRFDKQSLKGKVVSGLMRLARAHKKKLWVISGSSPFKPSQIKRMGIDQSFLLNEIAPMKECLNSPVRVLKKMARIMEECLDLL